MSLWAAPFDREEILYKLRGGFTPTGRLILPGACRPEAFELPRLRPFFLAHRGRYQTAPAARFVAPLRRFAHAATGLVLGKGAARVQRFEAQGYTLFADDEETRREGTLEVTLDLSSGVCGGPALYQSATERLLIPQSPGLAALVLRTPGLYRRDAYLPHDVGTAAVVRLRAVFDLI